METLTQNNFIETIHTTNPNKITLVQFTADWCSICQDFQPTLDSLESEYSKSVLFTKVDIDKDPDLADKYHISKLPTFLFFKNGKIIDIITGAEPASSFKNIIEDAQK